MNDYYLIQTGSKDGRMLFLQTHKNRIIRDVEFSEGTLFQKEEVKQYLKKDYTVWPYIHLKQRSYYVVDVDCFDPNVTLKID